MRRDLKTSLLKLARGFTGTSRSRPGLDRALAACRAGDTFVVTKLDRLARSLPDAREITAALERRGTALSLGGSTYDPSGPVRRLLFNVLGMVAEFEADLIRARTREGMAVARARAAFAASSRRSPPPGSAPRTAPSLWRTHHRRDRRAVRSRAVHGLSSDRPGTEPQRWMTGSADSWRGALATIALTNHSGVSLRNGGPS